METIKQEQLEETASETNIKIEDDKTQPKPEIVKLPSFQCAICQLNEKYDYFGMNPPYMRHYLLLEDSYTIEDPFLPPKQGEFIILGANCIKCRKSVCKDQECSIYFDGTICLKCAKDCMSIFPTALQDKINKIISK
ncbi:cysteine-rich pdf motif domain-containing protein 1 [Holotrichia oblita]|nr:cysteine-rich pdf motif domain-containing protein 1 [Holotrichia oblita]